MNKQHPIADTDLVSQTLQGDNEAFDQLTLKYQPRIARLVGRFIYEPAEVNDVTQDIFIKAYRSLGNFRGDSAFYTWLYRIAINTAKNYTVAQHRRPPSCDIDIDLAQEQFGTSKLKEYATPEHLLLRDEIEAAFYEVVESLPENFRYAIILRELEGYSYEEIAEVLDCPIGTVRSRLSRARLAFEQYIQRE